MIPVVMDNAKIHLGKEIRKSKARTYKDLINSITDAMLQVAKKDTHNWFTHSCYRTP
jgi:hypothetical protein